MDQGLRFLRRELLDLLGRETEISRENLDDPGWVLDGRCFYGHWAIDRFAGSQGVPELVLGYFELVSKDPDKDARGRTAASGMADMCL
jgi:hypothetical protein